MTTLQRALIAVLLLYMCVLILVVVARHAVASACVHGDASACEIMNR